MATRTNNNRTYYINPATLTFNENSGYGPNLIQVSASSSCYITVSPANGVGYSDVDRNYRRWKITAYNNKFPDDESKYPGCKGEWNIYVRLERTGTSALIVYDQKERGINGGIITEVTNENGNVSKVEGEHDPTYFFVKIGAVGATDGKSIRSITYDTGMFNSDESNGDKSDELWELDSFQVPPQIRAKYWLSPFTIKNGFSIADESNAEKKISNIVRSDDYRPDDLDPSDEYLISDEVVPTSQYVEDNFLNTKKEDVIEQMITWLKGFKSDNFQSGELGSGFVLKSENGRSYMELDELLVRKVAYFLELNIKKIKHVGGTLILTPASMTVESVSEENAGYVCKFRREKDGESIENEFRVGDMVRSQTFNAKEGVNQNVNSQYYWRLVVATGKDWIQLSYDDCDPAGKDNKPQVGDEIVQLGNKGYIYAEDPNDRNPNPARQNAIILSTVGDDAPSLKQYTNIHSYDLSEATLVTVLSPKGNRITSQVLVNNGEGGVDDIGEALKDIKYDYEKVMNQLDKEFTMWFYPWVPSAENEPEKSWPTENDKTLHEEDLFYCTNKDDKENYGKVWRYVMLESGEFVWSPVTDAATIAAMEQAAAAQETADIATGHIDKITSDEWLSPDEKKEVRREWEEITACRKSHIEMALLFGLIEDVENPKAGKCDELNRYLAAYENLGVYMSDNFSGEEGWQLGLIPIWINDENMGEYTSIIPEDYRRFWMDYYDRERRLQNKFADVARIPGENALDELAQIASDDWLTMDEKKEVLLEWQTITSRFQKFMGMAGKYGLEGSDEYLAYQDAYMQLGTYLNQNDRQDGDEEWDGETVPFILTEQANQLIDREEYMGYWKAFYDAEVDYQNALANSLDTRINNRIQAFVDTPKPPYNVGDRWSNVYWKMNPSDEDYFYQDAELVCWRAKGEGGSFDINDWRPVSDVSLSYLGTSGGKAELYAHWFGFEESAGVTSKHTSGLVSEANFSSLFAKAVTSEGEAKEALLEVAVTKDKDGNLDSSVLIRADNISINGITKGSGDNSVVIGGFDINENTISGGSKGTKMTLTVSDVSNQNPSISWGDGTMDYMWLGMYKHGIYTSGTMNLFYKEDGKLAPQSLNVLPYKIDFNGAKYGCTIYADDNWTYSQWTALNSQGLGTLEAKIGMSASSETTASHFTIYSNSWPKEGQVLNGYVYKDNDGYLKVKG